MGIRVYYIFKTIVVISAYVWRYTYPVHIFSTAIFQWIDGSAYSYRHHTLVGHNHTAGQFLKSFAIVESIKDVTKLLLNPDAHSYDNSSCQAVVSNFVTFYEWSQVSGLNFFFILLICRKLRLHFLFSFYTSHLCFFFPIAICCCPIPDITYINIRNFYKQTG